MKERPIIMSGDSVRAILEGRKTQTRRVAKEPLFVNLAESVCGDWPIALHCVAPAGRHRAYLNQHGAVSVETSRGLLGIKPAEFIWESPYGQPGDRLWVREAWACHPEYYEKKDKSGVLYRTDFGPEHQGWCSPIHMPRWASRLTLEILKIRVERVQDISANDALAEDVWGTKFWTPKELDGKPFEEKWWDDFEFITRYPQIVFQRLWNSINEKRGFGWDVNPWVWVLDFKRTENDQRP